MEQQLTNNNVNGGGNFIQSGSQQINVREVGLVTNVHDIADTVLTTKNGTPLRIRDIAVVQQGAKVRLGQFARARHLSNGKIVDNDDVVSGIVLLRKGAESDSTLVAVHKKVDELNNGLLPPRCSGGSVPRPQRSGSSDHAHRAAQPDRRDSPGLAHPVCLSWKYSWRADRYPDHSLRASVRVHLS